MGTLKARVQKLESRRFLTAEQELEAMSDEELEAFLLSALKKMTPEELKEYFATYSKHRALYEELLARENAP